MALAGEGILWLEAGGEPFLQGAGETLPSLTVSLYQVRRLEGGGVWLFILNVLQHTFTKMQD